MRGSDDGMHLNLNPVIWLYLGFIGQGLFGARFLVQWLSSERKGRSVVPTVFWYFSIAGSAVLLTYAIHKSDPVFIAGEALSLVIFSRNLQLVLRNRSTGHD